MSARAEAQVQAKAVEAAAVEAVAVDRPKEYVRFTASQRVEHIAMMTVFSLLVITGLPQKYAPSDWAQTFAGAVGGVANLRYLHRVLGWILSIQTVLHLIGLAVYALGRKGPLSMVVNRKDFSDAVGTLKYYLGLRKHPPRYDRYDYKQKFEYWGMLMGSLVMVATGFVLLYPAKVASLLPGQLIPVSKMAHSNEGLMAMLVIVVWHLFAVIFNPDVFPLDTAIFTGKISRERMEHEHGLELDRIEGKKSEDSHS